MSVIVEFRIPAGSFELGRMLKMGGETTIDLETMVPVGGTAVPFIWVYNADRRSFEERTRNHQSVQNLKEVDVFQDRTLFALEWSIERDDLFGGIAAQKAQILSAKGEGESWAFEVRFPDHKSLSDFQEHCYATGIELDVLRVYNPSKPGTVSGYGLTARQREALLLAVRRGYYDIPRRSTTVEIADELDISNQAVTERLRRAITSLVTNTLLTGDSDE
ncbi:helix-turn-helix domain-containing protein [Halegenticoccus soli]|uniref:helix-turn-helix domain-containing protein n=1 Tax=Halegenticoccus soli TaxID=1985678 RepID=UPI000C6DD7B3|nr:helix-turn-helix domain-containing protein [Halegenticoccus soli]